MIVKSKLFSIRRSDYLKCEHACRHTRRRKGLLWSIWNLGADLLAYLQPSTDTLYTGGARQFYSADKTSMQHTDSAFFSTGDIDFLWAGWVYADTLSGVQSIAAKDVGGSREFYIYSNSGAIHFLFGLGDVTGPTITTGTWNFVVAWHDSTANTINVQVNNGTIYSTSHSTGTTDTSHAFILGGDDYLGEGVTSYFWNGRFSRCCMLKNTAARAVIDSPTTQTAMYNLGRGVLSGNLDLLLATLGTFTAGVDWDAWNLNETDGTADARSFSGLNDLTPTFGELFIDPGMEDWASATNLTSWTEWFGGTANQESTEVDSGTYSAALLPNGAGQLAAISQAVMTSGHSYTLTVRAKRSATAESLTTYNNGTPISSQNITTSFATYTWSFTAGGTTVMFGHSGVVENLYVDNASLKATTIPACDGPSSDIAPDTGSVGTAHGQLIGFADSETARSTDVPSAIGSGTSLVFDGVDDSVSTVFAGNAASGPSGAAAYTLEAWVKATSSATYQFIAGWYGSAIGPSLTTGTSTNDWLVSISDAVYGNLSTASITDGWHHLCMVYDGSLADNATRLKLYLDGVLQTLTFTGTVPATLSAQTTNFVIGNKAAWSPFAGNLDSVRTYSVALSAAQALQRYQGTEATGATPEHEWTFDEETSISISDGDPISILESSEGNRYQFIQATASKRPTYAANAFGTGKPGLLFDGVNDLLVKTSAIFSGPSGEVHAQVKMSTLQSYETILASSDEASASYYIAFMAHALAARMGYSQKNNDTVDDLKGGTEVTTASYVMSFYSDGGTIYLALSNAVETITVITGSNTGDWFSDTTNKDNTTIGALKTSSESNWFNGYIGKIIVTNALNASQRNSVINYLLGGI